MKRPVARALAVPALALACAGPSDGHGAAATSTGPAPTSTGADPTPDPTTDPTSLASTSNSTSTSTTDSPSTSTTDSPSTSTGEASTGAVVDPSDCSTNPIPWCDADTKPTPNGVPDEPAGLGGCPAGMARVATFCVDRWEAALVEVLPGDALGPWSPYRSPAGALVRAVSAPGLVPQGYISQIEAAAACDLAGKRLCTDDEWLRACQGAASHVYPFGDVAAPGVCNDARACHPAVQYFESTEPWIWSELGHPCLDQLPEGLAATGAHPGCVSDDGILDMMGNLHEWTADPAGTFRGGYYVDTQLNGPGCLYKTTAHDISHWDYSTGFRCCAD